MKEAKNMSATARAKGTMAPTDADELLKQDHRKVEGLFGQYEKASDSSQKKQLAKKICLELIVHTKIEEELFYPACREKNVEDEILDGAQVEHDGAKILIAELLDGSPDDDFYDAKVAVLSEYIKHHVGEEEKPGAGILAKARSGGVDMRALGTRIQARKTELVNQSDALSSRPPRPKSLHATLMQSRMQKEDSSMPRYFDDRDRDEQGRFMSDDERRSSRGFSQRGRYDNDYGRTGSEGRGWYGDRDGHSEASERGWENRGRGSSARGRDYDDDGGRYGRGENGGRGRGWYGDAQGHSEASERGWEDRGHGSASRNRDYDDDRRYSRGHGGWYGDSQGHSEASERGWEHRGRGSSSRSRDYDDDDRRSSRGSGGHGGWYGDSRGHAEAARRGWEDR